MAPEDPARQAEARLANLRTLVGVHGFTIDDVRRLTVHVVGPHPNLTEAWSAVVRWFDGEVPPATLLGSYLFGHAGQLVEIDATIFRSPATLADDQRTSVEGSRPPRPS